MRTSRIRLCNVEKETSKWGEVLTKMNELCDVIIAIEVSVYDMYIFIW